MKGTTKTTICTTLNLGADPKMLILIFLKGFHAPMQPTYTTPAGQLSSEKDTS